MYVDKAFNFPLFGLPSAGSVDLSIAAYPMPVVVFDDFLLGTPLTAPQTTGPWAVQGVGTATVAALAASVSGEIAVGTSATSGDTGVIRTPIPIQLTAGKPAAVFCRMRQTAVANQNAWFGLLAVGSNAPLAATNFQGYGFAIINTAIRYAASASAVDYTTVATTVSQTAAAATYIDLCIVWTGSKVQFYINQILVGESTVAATGTALYPQIGVATTAASAVNVVIDYMGYNAQR